MKKYYFVFIFCTTVSLSSWGQSFKREKIRLALPYKQASFELIPFYWALQRKRFETAGLELRLLYTGSSRAAIETVLQKKSDIALSDAQIFTIFAAQLQPISAFLQYQQTLPFTRLATLTDRKNHLYLVEEDAIPTAIILFNQVQTEKDGVALFKERAHFWSLLPLCDEQGHFFDRKNTLQETQSCSFSSPLLIRKSELYNQRNIDEFFENPLPQRVAELPGSLFLLHNDEVVAKRLLFQRFSKIVIGEMRETFLFPEQIRERGLWPMPEKIVRDQRLIEIVRELAHSFYSYQPRLEFGQLYAQRYKNLIEVMEKLNLILPGLTSDTILKNL